MPAVSKKYGRRCRSCGKKMRHRKDGRYPRVCRACFRQNSLQMEPCCLRILLEVLEAFDPVGESELGEYPAHGPFVAPEGLR